MRCELLRASRVERWRVGKEAVPPSQAALGEVTAVSAEVAATERHLTRRPVLERDSKLSGGRTEESHHGIAERGLRQSFRSGAQGHRLAGCLPVIRLRLA
jgi:hypothetical protein